MRRLLSAVFVGALVLGLLPGAGVAQEAPPAPLPVPQAEPNVDLPPGLTPYHEIAPRINDIVARSQRVQAEVIGKSAEGRDLYLVTVSRPKVLRKYRALRSLMLFDPQRAQALLDEFGSFKVPIYVNGSIHGNEWEGVDASLELIEHLAFDNSAQTHKVLDNTFIQFNVVANPDGRVHGTRRNGADFDLNRDFITQSQPETRAMAKVISEWNPMVALDLHGYVNPMLIEPATPPHNPNYEYDLYIKWALNQAKAMERGVLAAYDERRDDFTPDIAETLDDSSALIPFRDLEVGDWDDWPPIFTPMYAMYHGAYGHTLEAPLRVNGGAVELPAADRAARAQLNTAAHYAAVWAALQFAAENKMAMIRDQIEIFERGAAAAQPMPIEPGFVPGFGPEDQYVANYPAGYVIPMGRGQDSDVAATRLANFLIRNNVVVRRADRPIRANGVRYEAGSWVVSMKQPLRGLANTVLERGYDISHLTPQMYDISGWSHALLWGATVDTIPRGERVPWAPPARRPVRLRGTVDPLPAAAYALELDDPAAVEATNRLLSVGVPLQRATADFDGFEAGTVIVPRWAQRSMEGFARFWGVDFHALESRPRQRTALEAPRIAAAASGDELFVLRSLGFAVDEVDADTLNAGLDLSPYDVLLVSGLDLGDLDGAARERLDAWVAAGGGVVGRGAGGAQFNVDAGLLDVGYEQGPECSRANGIVAVVNDGDSPVMGSEPTKDTSFVYGPVWFTDVAADVRVDQRLAAGDFFVAGHWLGDDEQGSACPFDPGEDLLDPSDDFVPAPDTGQEDAAGDATVVSGTAGGSRVVLFGTDPLFRAHPKKLFVQMANAVYWSAGG